MALPTIANDNTLFNTDDFLSPEVYQEGVAAIVDRLKREGDLTRNSGTNSIKSLKEVSFNLLTSTELHLDYMKQLLDNFGGLENSIKDTISSLPTLSGDKPEEESSENKSVFAGILDYFRKKEITDEEESRERKRGLMSLFDFGKKDEDKKDKKPVDLFSVLKKALIGFGILGLGAVFTNFSEIFGKLKDYITDSLLPALENFYERGIKPFYENVIKPIADWFASIALPALGETFTRFINDITDFFSGLGEVGKLIGEGDYLGAAKKAVEAIGKFLVNSIDNLLTLGADLVGIDLEGETAFGAIGNWFTDLSAKISTWFKENIYDSETGKIFGSDLPEKLFEFNMFQTIKQPIDDVIDTIEQIFSGDFSMETLLKGGKAFLDLVYAPLNLAINAIKDIFKWGDPEEPFRLSKFITDAVASVKSFFTNEEGTGLFDFDLSKIELPDFDIGKKFKEFIDEIGKFISDMIPSKESVVAGAAKAIAGDDGKITGGEKALSTPLNLLGYSDSELETLIAKYAEPKEKGGPIQEDKPYLVGEAGPELIIPNSSGKVIPAPQTGAILDAGSRMMADNARVSVSPVIAPQSNDNRTIVSNKSVTYQGHMTTRNSDPTIRALNSSLAYA